MSQAPKGQERPPAPKGNHLGICVRIYDLGTQKEEYQGKPKMNRKLRFGFELPNKKYVFDEKKGPQPFVVDVTYNFFFTENSNFYKAMSSWTGGDLAPDFDIEDMLGKPAMVNISHTGKDGKVYANIEGLTPIPEELEDRVPKPENKPVYWSVENGRDSTFEKLPEFLRKMAESSIEWNTETPDDAPVRVGEEPNWNVGDEGGSL